VPYQGEERGPPVLEALVVAEMRTPYHGVVHSAGNVAAPFGDVVKSENSQSSM
jgi:hypothetical protein